MQDTETVHKYFFAITVSSGRSSGAVDGMEKNARTLGRIYGVGGL